jgi:hypothetical protein
MTIHFVDSATTTILIIMRSSHLPVRITWEHKQWAFPRGCSSLSQTVIATLLHTNKAQDKTFSAEMSFRQQQCSSFQIVNNMELSHKHTTYSTFSYIHATHLHTYNQK